MGIIALQIDGTVRIAPGGTVAITPRRVDARRPRVALGLAVVTSVIAVGALGPRAESPAPLATEPISQIDAGGPRRAPLRPIPPIAGLRLQAVEDAVIVRGLAAGPAILELSLMVGRVQLSSRHEFVAGGWFVAILPVVTGSTDLPAEVSIVVDNAGYRLPVLVTGRPWHEWVDPATGLTVRARSGGLSETPNSGYLAGRGTLE